MPYNRTPTYNLKAVLKETGIAADTLRAWERRYGLPIPQRTPGGHRLYSQYDIGIIKWLIMKQGEGLSISRAVDMWGELISSGMDPLSAHQQNDMMVPPAANLLAIRQAWLEACLTFDEASAERILNQAFAMYPTETVCVEVLQGSIMNIGEKWFTGEANVQHEHFASSLATRRLDALIAAAPAPTRPFTVLVGCPPDEWHSLSLLMTSLFLRRRGLNVIYLGANVPLEQFNDTVAMIRPHLIILASQQLHTSVSLRDTAKILSEAGEIIGYGGRIFNILPELRNHIPAHFLGETLETAIQTIESLLGSKFVPVPTRPVPSEFMDALHLYRGNKSLIEAHIVRELTNKNLPIQQIHAANHFMDINLSASLEMGNLAFMETEIFWIGEYLGHIKYSQAEVYDYLLAYHSAIEAELAEQGKLLTDWFRKFISESAQNESQGK